jgi:hypothetical protein
MKNNRGFAHLEMLVVIVVLAAIGFIGWKLMAHKNKDGANTSTKSDFVEWNFDGNTWKAMGDAPKCEDPLVVSSPVNVDEVDGVLMPGEVRGGDFKPHGGFSRGGFDNPNKVDVSAIRDAYVYQGARYLHEGRVVQYMFDFMDSCGIRYRLDHLATLTPDFQKLADKLPEAKPDDSRTTKFDPVLIKKGTLIATEIGIKTDSNAFFDFGVYDLRTPNEASKTDLYKTDQLRISDKEQSFFALCWKNYMQGAEKTAVAAMPLRNGDPQGASDYCK